MCSATAALAAVSFVALTASAVMAYRLAVDRFGLGRPEGIFAALFVLVAQLYASPFGVDPLAICVVVLALYFVERVSVFAVILVASVIVNEKIAILFVVWLTIRCVLRADDRRALGPQWLASIAAIVAYGVLLAVVRLPGHGEQLDPGVYFPTLVQNVVASVTTTRGLMFNIVPCALLIGVVAWSWRTLGWQRHRIYARLDLLVDPGARRRRADPHAILPGRPHRGARRAAVHLAGGAGVRNVGAATARNGMTGATSRPRARRSRPAPARRSGTARARARRSGRCARPARRTSRTR